MNFTTFMIMLNISLLFHSRTCVSGIHKFASLTPQTSSIDGATVIRDPQVFISGTYWDLRLQPDVQSPFDLKLNFNNEWRFQSNDISTISITLNGLPLIDTSHDMTLFLVFAVNDLQYLSLSIHLDNNGKKYASYSSLTNNKQTVSDWISNNNLYDLRSYRISNGNEWMEYEPEHTTQSIWPITFEFINDAINNKLTHQFYSRNVPVIHQELPAAFATNTPFNVYIMTNEPEENLYISTIDVSLSYDSTPMPSIYHIDLYTTANPTTQATKSPNPIAISTLINDTLSPTKSPTFSPSNPNENPAILTLRQSADIDHSFTYILIAICASVMSFLCGITIGLIVCKWNKIHHKPDNDEKQKHNHKHKAIPKQMGSDNKSETSEKSLQRIASQTKMPLINKINSDAQSAQPNNTVNVCKINSDAQSNMYQGNRRKFTMNSNAESLNEDSDEYEDMYTTEPVVHCSPTTLTEETNHNPLVCAVRPRASQSMQSTNYLREESGISECDDGNDGADEIKEWLQHDVLLPQYLENFGSYGYESLKFVREISNKTELCEIGIVVKGHQTKIMAEIGKLTAFDDELEGVPRK